MYAHTTVLSILVAPQSNIEVTLSLTGRKSPSPPLLSLVPELLLCLEYDPLNLHLLVTFHVLGLLVYGKNHNHDYDHSTVDFLQI